MASVPQTYTISDFIEWNSKKQLILSPDFQRGSVWTPSAKMYLIDTILSDFPIPQIYFRTKIDPITQTTVREVVDGQQRLRSILEFAANEYRLTSKAPKHKGKNYNDLELEDKEQFLSYKISVVQLLNATNADVLEVFARLNSYSVKVTPPELRHAKYSEPVKWAIYYATKDWTLLWAEYAIVNVRDSVRLRNTSVIAEMFMIIDHGFNDGGEIAIDKYYRDQKNQTDDHFSEIRKNVDLVIEEILKNTKNDFLNTTFYDAPNFLTLFATVAFLHGFVPTSRTTDEIENKRGAGINWEIARNELAELAQAFDNDIDQPTPSNQSRFATFISATKSTTHRISSRKIRLQTLVNILSNK